MDSRRKGSQLDGGGGETAVISDKTIVLNPSDLPVIFGWLVETNQEKTHRISTDVFHIGSGEAADLTIRAGALKEIHCSIYFVNDHFEINDNNTKSGTKVNGVVVKRQELRDGDLITAADSSMLFKCFRGMRNG